MARPTLMRGGVYDKQLEELVQASSWKQAFTLCEKRIKKGDKSEESLIAKAHILLLWPDKKRQQQGRAELAAIISKAQPITNLRVLVSIVLFSHYRREAQDSSLWERAIKARPRDEELYRTWFYTSFSVKAWGVAQKASVAYKNAFPQRREPHFWYIITNHIQMCKPIMADNERRMYAQLNYRTLAKAASAVSDPGSTPSTGLTLETLEDLLLLLRVYRSQGKAKEALVILDDDRVGINSRVGNKAWELVRQKVDLLGESGQHREQWLYCHALLEDARPDHMRDNSISANSSFGKIGDDWKVWSGLIVAARQIDTEEIAVLTETIIESYGSCSRNAQIALLKFYSSDPDESVYNQARLLASCCDYFKKYSSKLVCFHDLNPFVICLDQPNQIELLKRSEQEARQHKPFRNDPEWKAVKWLTSEINALKLDYYLVVSKHPNYYDRSLLEAFVCNCLRLYKISLTLGSKLPSSERRPGDDAAVLAVMAMLHLIGLQEPHFGLRCVILLDFLLARSRHNYDALLLQVRLNLFLGTGSMAVERYSQLCIKNIQHATLSWILFTRISTLHPLLLTPPAQGRPWFAAQDPTESLTAALDWHMSAEQINGGSIEKMLADAKYNMLFDALELGHSIENGFAKLISLIEWLRIQRLGGVTGGKDYAELLRKQLWRSQISYLATLIIGLWKGDAQDNRDTAAFPSCESPFQDPHTRLWIDRWFTTKQLNGRWLSKQINMAWFWEFLHDRTTIATRASLTMGYRESEQANIGTQLEDRERHTIQVLENLCLMAPSEQHEDHEFNMLAHFMALEEILNCFVKELDAFSSDSGELLSDFGFGFAAPNWRYYHWLFILLDICQFCRASIVYLLTVVREKHLVDPEFLVYRCERLKVLMWKLTSLTEANVSQQQDFLRAGIVTNNLAHAARWGLHSQQDAVGKAFESLIGQPSLESTVTNVCESWLEAMGGVIKAQRHVSIRD